MYSLALIIFVVSEKKAFEHFPIGSNVSSNAFFSETTNIITAKLPMNDHWKVLYKVCVFNADRKSKMATTAGHRLTLDPMGKCSNAKAFEHFPIGFNVNLCIAVADILDFRLAYKTDLL
jgi:hypothetical protein